MVMGRKMTDCPDADADRSDIKATVLKDGGMLDVFFVCLPVYEVEQERVLFMSC
jgi:hypothetical protein